MYTPTVENLSTRYLTVVSDGACLRNPRPVALGRVDDSDTVSLKRDAAFLRGSAIRTVIGAWIMLPGNTDDEGLRWLDVPIGRRRMPFDELVVAFTPAAAARPHPQ